MKNNILILLVFLAFLNGCDSDSPSDVGGQMFYGENWFAADGEWDDQLRCMIIFNCPSPKSSCNGSCSQKNHFVWNGYMVDPWGFRREWRCETSDGIVGDVTVNSEKYRLENGSLFLVNCEESGRATVLQLKIDLEDYCTQGEIEELIFSNSEVSDFLDIGVLPMKLTNEKGN